MLGTMAAQVIPEEMLIIDASASQMDGSATHPLIVLL